MEISSVTGVDPVTGKFVSSERYITSQDEHIVSLSVDRAQESLDKARLGSRRTPATATRLPEDL